MSDYDLLLLVAGGTALFMLLLGRFAFAGWLGTGAYTAQGWLLLKMAGTVRDGGVVPATTGFEVLGQEVSWQLDVLGWFFAVITLGSALVVTWFSAGAWGRDFVAKGGNRWLLNTALALNVLFMLLLLGSGDLLSLFVGWELVSWAGFLLMTSAGREHLAHAVRYLVYATAGAMAVLAAMAIAWHAAGDLSFTGLQAAIPGMGTATLWWLVLLLVFGFGVKMGILPLHLWQANAYAYQPGPAAGFLGAISSRMGLFAILLVVIKLVGIARLEGLSIVGSFSARDLLAWVAVLTLIIPTFIALRQYDARKLLAWHGIGQGGYMLIGVLVGTELGSAGGLMHVFNHATYQGILFLAVAAVMYRTGTADLNKMGGLVVRMPLTFLVLLVGIIGLAGLPPMNGFVSKLLVYRSLVNEGMPLLFLGTVIGTLGTILSVYKLIHNIFLGQLRCEHEEIHEVPWSMMLPMLAVSVIVFLTGFMPGLVLEWIAPVQVALGLDPVPWTLGGVEASRGNQLDMLWIVGILFAGVAIAAILFHGFGNKTKRVHQLDNYAGGHFLDAETRYQYSDHFYAGLMHHIGPWYRGSFRWAEQALVSTVDYLATLMQRLSWQKVQAFSMVVLAVGLLAWSVS